ncbi:MAG: Fe-S cluster assembly protein SufD, partial [Candidatus Solibacter sp.]
MSAVAEQTGAWLEHFINQPPAPAGFEALRDAAFARFAALGFPNTHHEEWRFTNVSAIARTAFTPVAPDTLLVYPESVKKLEPAKAEAHLARHAAFDQNPFVALNTAFLGDLTVLEIPRGMVVETPIEITYEVPERPDLGPNLVAHPRTLILVGEGAHCTIVETYKGTGTYFTTAVTEIVVGDRAV